MPLGSDGARPQAPARVTPPDIGAANGIGRIIAMPLLEYLDAAGFTTRLRAGRRIRGNRVAPFGGSTAIDGDPAASAA